MFNLQLKNCHQKKGKKKKGTDENQYYFVWVKWGRRGHKQTPFCKKNPQGLFINLFIVGFFVLFLKRDWNKFLDLIGREIDKFREGGGEFNTKLRSRLDNRFDTHTTNGNWKELHSSAQRPKIWLNICENKVKKKVTPNWLVYHPC